MQSLKLASVEQQASYAIGLQIGQQLLGAELDNLDADAIAMGLKDVLNQQPPALSLEILQDALRQMHEQAEKNRAAQMEQVAKAGRDFLQHNLQQEGVRSTESGLQYKVLQAGSGALPQSTDRVRVHYTGRLIDGTVFDSSVARGEPAEFALNSVIPGWTEALQLMPVGSRWVIYLPHELAYGERGAGATIPPCSTLIFEVELLDIL